MSNLTAARLIEQEFSKSYFDVVTEDVYTTSGVRIPGKKVITREDNGAPIAVVGDRYKVVTNEEVFSSFTQILSKSDMDLSGAQVEVKQSHNGARTFAQVILPNHTIKVGAEDESALRIIARNSYDGTISFIAQAGGYRFVCSNGMILGKSIACYTGKHCKGLDLKRAAENISQMLNTFENSEDWFNELRETPVTDQQAYACLAYASRCHEAMRIGFVEYDKMPRVMKTLIKSWASYKHQLGRNAWALYNTMTHYSTHWDAERNSNHPNSAAAQARREDRVVETINSAVWRKAIAA